MAKSKSEVISDLTSKLLKEEELRDRAEEKVVKLQLSLDNKEKQRQKWYGLYKSQREASERNKQERKAFAKKATDSKQKLEETVAFPKINGFLLTVKEVFKKYISK